MKLYHLLTDLLFPPKCILCGQVLEDEETDLCHHCRIHGPEYPQRNLKLQFIDSFAAVWYYEGDVRRSLHRYKFSRGRYLASGYGRLLAMKVQQQYPEGFDLLTWVPISPLRKLSRGYDQDQLLAEALGRELGMEPVRLLKKIRNNPPQSGISGFAERRANVLGSYRIVNSANLAGKRILLVDDILTTGATAGECARVLLTAGAKEVHCAVIATAHHK